MVNVGVNVKSKICENLRLSASKLNTRRASGMVLVLLMLVALLGMGSGALAQTEDDVWGEPVNVSRSGAAEQPQIVAAPDGGAQAFWWDRFDGLMSARYDGETWSTPAPAPIIFTEVVTKAQVAELVYTPLDMMPAIVGDGRGWAYAFWIGEEDEETGGTPLMVSQKPLGSNDWSEPDVLAESASVFEVAAVPSGGLTLVYVRLLSSGAFPAGLYVKRSFGGGGGWGAPALVQASFYLRLLTPETAHLRLADVGDGTVHLAWDDPQLDQAFYARSDDGGTTWSAPEPLGDPEERSSHPHILPLADGGMLRLWETAGMGGCALYQQRLEAGKTPGGETPGGEASSGVSPAWTAPERVLDGASQCPQGERVWLADGGLLWLWGQGSGSLTLAGWDAEGERWSEPQSFSFRFEDPETERWIGLDGLQGALVEDTLIVAGVDPAGGEVWALAGQVDASALAFAPPSPWSGPVALPLEEGWPGLPAAAADAEGRVHVLWSASAAEGLPGAALYYARFESAAGSAGEGRWTQPTQVWAAPEGEKVAQPALLAVGERLHAVWSGGPGGRVFYSWAYARDAYAADGWSEPLPLPAPSEVGSAPAIVADPLGTLHVVYAVPVNEARGIYYTRSDDGGETWSEAAAVFDAEWAGWPTVDRPALAVDERGGLHVAWLDGSPGGPFSPQAVYYARSRDEGRSWSEPQELAVGGCDWPVLAATFTGQVHLLWSEVGASPTWLYRWSADGGETWAASQAVRGFGGIAGPVGLISDGAGVLHLIGLGQDDGGLAAPRRAALRYTTWTGEGWDTGEDVRLGERSGQPGAALALAPAAGDLWVIARGEAEAGTGGPLGLLGAHRSIPPVEEFPVLELTPRPTATATPVPTPLPTVTPLPAVDAGAPEAGPPVLEVGPLSLPYVALGGLAVAVVVVGGVVVARGLWLRRRRS
jgi:hypothetical protein